MANPLKSLVPGTGVEPVRGHAPRDFKSLNTLIVRKRNHYYFNHYKQITILKKYL